MNLIIVSDKLYPDEIGGSCTYAYETILELQKHNNVDIFTCYPQNYENDVIFNGQVYRKFSKKNPFKSAYELMKVINNNEYDLIVFHSIYSWLIFIISKVFIKKSLKQLAIFHGPWSKEAKSKYDSKNETLKAVVIPKIMNLIEKLYVYDNENYIFLSNYMKEQLNLIKSLDNKNTYIIPGGVRLENYKRNYMKNDAKEKLGINVGSFVIFIMRRLEQRMGIDNAIEAIDKLPNEVKKNITLIIGGKGEYESVLKEKAQKSNINYKFLGFIPDEDVNLTFCASDLFLVPSIDLEGFGLVNLESLAIGVPVLATPQGGMKELNEMFDNFYLADNMEIGSLSKKIEEIYNNSTGNSIIEENIKHYSWSKISQRIYQAMKEIIE